MISITFTDEQRDELDRALCRAIHSAHADKSVTPAELVPELEAHIRAYARLRQHLHGISGVVDGQLELVPVRYLDPQLQAELEHQPSPAGR